MAKSPRESILSPAIYDVAAELGAHTSGDRPLPKSAKACPKFVEEFYRRIVWPKRRVYEAPDRDPIGLTGVSFSGPEAVPPEQEVLGAEGKELIAFGIHNGGNWVLVFDGRDEHPENPMVYEVDHEPGGELEEIGRLSDFLEMLQPAS